MSNGTQKDYSDAELKQLDKMGEDQEGLEMGYDPQDPKSWKIWTRKLRFRKQREKIAANPDAYKGEHNMYTMLNDKNESELSALRDRFGEFEGYTDKLGRKRRRLTTQYERAKERHSNHSYRLQLNERNLKGISVSDEDYSSGMELTIGTDRFIEQSDGSGIKEENIPFLMNRALKGIGEKERSYEDMIIDGMNEKDLF